MKIHKTHLKSDKVRDSDDVRRRLILGNFCATFYCENVDFKYVLISESLLKILSDGIIS